MSDRKKLIDRISKLLAKPEGTDNPVEAETFMSKVHEMLEAHNIALHELGEADDPIHKSDNIMQVNRSLSYCTSLLPWLGAYYGCEVVYQRFNGKVYFTVYGRQSATMTFHLMAPYIMAEVRRRARQLHQSGQIPTYGKGLTAVANALTHRLTRLYFLNKQKDEARVASGGRALAPVDRVEALMQADCPGVTSNDRYPTKTTAAAQRAAEDIGLARQAEAQTEERRLLS